MLTILYIIAHCMLFEYHLTSTEIYDNQFRLYSISNSVMTLSLNYLSMLNVLDLDFDSPFSLFFYYSYFLCLTFY